MTPLHLAVGSGNLDMVKFLVEKGADINAKRADQGTPLHWACSAGFTECVMYLIEHGASINAADRFGIRIMMLFFLTLQNPTVFGNQARKS